MPGARGVFYWSVANTFGTPPEKFNGPQFVRPIRCAKSNIAIFRTPGPFILYVFTSETIGNCKYYWVRILLLPPTPESYPKISLFCLTKLGAWWLGVVFFTLAIAADRIAHCVAYPPPPVLPLSSPPRCRTFNPFPQDRKHHEPSPWCQFRAFSSDAQCKCGFALIMISAPAWT